MQNSQTISSNKKNGFIINRQCRVSLEIDYQVIALLNTFVASGELIHERKAFTIKHRLSNKQLSDEQDESRHQDSEPYQPLASIDLIPDELVFSFSGMDKLALTLQTAAGVWPVLKCSCICECGLCRCKLLRHTEQRCQMKSSLFANALMLALASFQVGRDCQKGYYV